MSFLGAKRANLYQIITTNDKYTKKKVEKKKIYSSENSSGSHNKRLQYPYKHTHKHSENGETENSLNKVRQPPKAILTRQKILAHNSPVSVFFSGNFLQFEVD